MIELETGVRRDGTLVARRARLVLDNGAYAADAPLLPADRGDDGRRPVPGRERGRGRRILAYTNNTPSGSVRAPTAPQVCWAVEQHMDESPRGSGIDPVELRRRNIVHGGDEGPTRPGVRRRSARPRRWSGRWR